LCHEKQGKTATAWSEFDEVVSQSAKKGDRPREQFARERASATEKVLSRVTLVVPAGVKTVDVDGQSLGEAAWATALPLDPGEHTFTLAAPGKQARFVRTQVGRGPLQMRVAPPALEDEPVALAPPKAHEPHPDTPEARDTPEVKDEPTAHSGSGRRTAGFVLGGIGVVALGAGGVLGLMALGKKSDVDSNCNGRECNKAGYDAQSSAHTLADVSTVACAVAAAGLGVGAYLVLSSGSTPAKRAMRVGPVATGGGAVLQLEGGF
jgi:hypothetical protein